MRRGRPPAPPPSPVPTEPDPAADSAAVDAETPAPRSAPPLRRGRLAAVAVALLAAGFWFAPALVARSGLRHTALHRIFPELNADVTVGRAELAWLSPATLHDVTVRPAGGNPGGEPLLTVAEVRTGRPLHELLSAALFPGDAPAEYGTVTLDEPHLRVALRPGGSDLEEALAPLLAGDSAGAPPGYAVAVKDGSVSVADAAGARLTGRELTGAVRVPAGSSTPDRATLAGWWGDGERSGQLALKLGEEAPERWALRADGLPLTAARPLLTRFAAERETGAGGATWTLDGALSGDLAGLLGAEGWTAAGEVSGERLTVRGVDWPPTDRLRVAAATLSGGLAGDARGLRARRLAFASGLLDLSVDGPLPTAVPADPLALLDVDRALTGRVDAAALADQLPGLLGLIEGATIDAGTLTFSARTGAAGAGGDGRRLEAAVDLAGLRAALPGGERIAPAEPVVARLSAARDAAGVVTVDRLAARADGLSIVGRGVAEDLSADVNLDLAALDRTFGRLLALGGRWSGAATGSARVRRPAPDRFAARLALVGRDLRFDPASGGPGLREEEVSVKFGAEATRDAAGTWTPSLTGVRADAGGDVLTITPVDSHGLSLTLLGELESVKRRAGLFAGLPDVSATGDVRASVVLRPEGARWRIEQGRAEVRRLAVDAPGLRLRDPAVTLTAAGTFDPASGSVAGTFEGVGDALSVRATRFTFDPTAGPALLADLSATGDAGRVWGWFPAEGAPAPRPEGRFAVKGSATGSVGAGGFEGAGFVGEATVADLVLLTPPDPRAAPGTPWGTAWREPTATVVGSVRYDAAGDVVHLGPLAATAGGASLTAGGTIADPAGRMNADLSGRLSADWATLAPRLGLPAAGVALAGASDRAFVVRGPLGAPTELSARAGLAWSDLRAGGFAFGPGDLVATLDRGRVRIDGVDWPLVPIDQTGAAGEPGVRRAAAGRIRTTPRIDLNGREPVLRLPAGRALSDVRLTPAVTRGWLGMMSPLAAGSAAADGAFDLDLDGAVAPLSDLLAGDFRRTDAGGRLVIERADLTAGPVAGGLLGAVRDAGSLLRGSAGDLGDVRVALPAQTVPFRIAGGRVFHQNLTARSGSVEVATTGSVGLDGTLDLRAEVPLGRDLGGRRLSVPVRGTLAAPQVDVARFAAAAAQGAVDQAVERERDRFQEKADREIERGLDKLGLKGLFGRE